MTETAPIILTAQMGPTDQKWANDLRRAHFPHERNFLDAHITLFHHLPPTQLPEIKARLAAMAAEYAPPIATVHDLMFLGRGVAYQLHSPELLAMRAELAEAFRGLLIPQDLGRPRLHITVQNKVAPPIAKALYAELLKTFQPRSLAITGLSAYYYRGGPWDAIRSWTFRGG
jgi:2'-5' RNA ligase superfamily